MQPQPSKSLLGVAILRRPQLEVVSELWDWLSNVRTKSSKLNSNVPFLARYSLVEVYPDTKILKISIIDSK